MEDGASYLDNGNLVECMFEDQEARWMGKSFYVRTVYRHMQHKRHEIAFKDSRPDRKDSVIVSNVSYCAYTAQTHMFDA